MLSNDVYPDMVLSIIISSSNEKVTFISVRDSTIMMIETKLWLVMDNIEVETNLSSLLSENR
jgi:hypothetical protein